MDSSLPSVCLQWSALRKHGRSTCLEFILLVCHIREREDRKWLASIRRLIVLKEMDFYAHSSRGHLEDLTRRGQGALEFVRGTGAWNAGSDLPPPVAGKDHQPITRTRGSALRLIEQFAIAPLLYEQFTLVYK
jgi:hypothetical protein